MTDQHILAIDLGTSGPKVAIVSVSGRIVGGVAETTDLQLLTGGGAEQDPAAWWQAICRATRRLLGQQLVPTASIVGVAVTSQWSGTVPVDEQGSPLMNAIIWMDSRGARYVAALTGGFPKIEGYGVDKLWHWVRKTGGIPTHSGKDSIAHILFIRYERPEIYRRTYKFLEPKDYINLRLTGRFAATFDSITLHWVTDNRDIHNVRYDEQLLRMAGIDREKLPELVRATDVLGSLTPEAARDLGLDEHVEVVAGTPDIHSAAVGSGAVADYAVHCYVGTSSWLSCHVPFKKTDVVHNMASLPSALPGRYLLINEHETAGACLIFAKTVLQQAQVDSENLLFEELEAAAAGAAPGSGGAIFTPWLHGERSPVDDRTMRGGWHNLSLQTTQGDLVRAVYEGVALNTRWLFKYVERFIKRRIDSVHMVGGGARSAFWCQIHADVLQRPVHQVQDPLQANTRGVALLGAVGLRYLAVEEVDRCVPIAQTFEPNPAHKQLYDDYFDAFVEIYRKTNGLYRWLSKK
ncbi:MAG: xylulose kinase [Caldilineaceae bacterium]|nr:xylulose kinase [Caldilineaceae bacterium]